MILAKVLSVNSTLDYYETLNLAIKTVPHLFRDDESFLVHYVKHGGHQFKCGIPGEYWSTIEKVMFSTEMHSHVEFESQEGITTKLDYNILNQHRQHFCSITHLTYPTTTGVERHQVHRNRDLQKWQEGHNGFRGLLQVQGWSKRHQGRHCRRDQPSSPQTTHTARLLAHRGFGISEKKIPSGALRELEWVHRSQG